MKFDGESQKQANNSIIQAGIKCMVTCGSDGFSWLPPVPFQQYLLCRAVWMLNLWQCRCSFHSTLAAQVIMYPWKHGCTVQGTSNRKVHIREWTFVAVVESDLMRKWTYVVVVDFVVHFHFALESGATLWTHADAVPTSTHAPNRPIKYIMVGCGPLLPCRPLLSTSP
jgi:hypothetical protein